MTSRNEARQRAEALFKPISAQPAAPSPFETVNHSAAMIRVKSRALRNARVEASSPGAKGTIVQETSSGKLTLSIPGRGV